LVGAYPLSSYFQAFKGGLSQLDGCGFRFDEDMKREEVRFEFWQGACKSRWCQAQSTLNLHTKQDAMLKSSISGPKDSLGDEARIPQFSSNTQGGSKPSRPRMDPPSHGQTFHADSSRCSQSVLTFYHGASFGNVSAGTPMISPGNALTTMA